MSTTHPNLRPLPTKKSSPVNFLSAPGSFWAFDLSMLGEYIVISDKPLKLKAKEIEGVVIRGEVVTIASRSKGVSVGKYVTISPTIPSRASLANPSAAGRIVQATASEPHPKGSYVIVSDHHPTERDGFSCGFTSSQFRPMNASKGAILKYITLCDSLPSASGKACGHVIGKIIDLDSNPSLKSLRSRNLVIAVEVPEISVSESISDKTESVGQAPSLTKLLETTAKGVFEGKLRTHSNADDVKFMKNMVTRLERHIASVKSKEGHPSPK